MKRTYIQLLATIALLLLAANAQAAISCNISSSGFTTAYNPAAASQNITQSQFTVTCQRNLGTDPTTQDFSAEADTGTTARFGANTINYDLFRDSLCGSRWTTFNSRRLPIPTPGTMTLSGSIPTSVTVAYWGCIPTGQSRPAGIYTDTTTMYLYSGTGNTLMASATFPVAIHVSSTCNITTTPASLVFNYVSFGPLINPTTTLGVKCTNLLPYTVALDSPTTGTLIGLDYSLALSPAGGTGGGTGGGSPERIHTITGTMAAGQAGTCAVGACTATQSHTLTITY
jgi:spore coat protein U-like protein